MRTELATAIIAAIAGVLISFFVCNLFIGEIKPVSVKVIDSSVNANLANPDPEVFNYKALNPTVEVYVGSCSEYNDAGECIDQVTEEEFESITEQNTNQTTNQNSSNSQNSNNNQGNR